MSPLDVFFVVIQVLCVTSIAVFATTIYLHRALAHKAIEILSEAFERFLYRAILITTGLDRDKWVAVHRKHHTFTDEERDPHSPLVLGFWKIELFNVYYYIRAAKTPGIVEKFAKDIPLRWGDSPALRGFRGLALGISVLIAVGVVYSFSRGYFALYPLLYFVLYSVLYGVYLGFLVAFLHAFLYVFVLSPSINGLCHWWGVKRFPDTPAYNIRLLGWLVGGEGLHNNHHKYPPSPKFSIFKGDFDPSWPVIKGLANINLILITGKIATDEPAA